MRGPGNPLLVVVVVLTVVVLMVVVVEMVVVRCVDEGNGESGKVMMLAMLMLF